MENLKNKEWKSTSQTQSILYINDEKIGEFNRIYSSCKMIATFSINNNNYTIKNSGFWKNKIDIFDENDNLVLKMYAKNWYSNCFIVEFEGREFNLKIRNKPMAGYVIFDKDKEELISYNLDMHNRQIVTRIETNYALNKVIFDFLIWLLFSPIAKENNANDAVFISLMVN
jgi:hypothetical protein